MNQSILNNLLEQVLVTAQAGLTYSKDPFDIERFGKLKDLVSSFISLNTGNEFSLIRDWIDLDTNYPTPKIDVRAMILDTNRKVLLVREKCDGCWTLPGGWCDIGESAGEAVAREVAEETGLIVEPKQLLALYDKHKHPHPPQLPHAFKAFFSCACTGGQLKALTNETSGAAYFSHEELPPLSKHRVLESQIRNLWSHIVDQKKETLFD